MVMWIMSDRTIPRSFRFMEGFGVHTFRLVNGRRQIDLRQVPLEAEAGAAVGRVERGGQDQRGRPRLPPPGPVGRDRHGRLPRVGAGRAAVRRRLRREVRVRHSRRDQDHPRGRGAGPDRWAARARPGRRQLLRRDRAGRLLHPERGAGDRLHRRPAAAGPELLLPRHAAQAARRPELHPHPDQRPEVPVPPLPAGRAHGDAEPEGPGQLRAELVGPGRRPAGVAHRVPELPPAGRGGQSPGAVGDVRRPLQPGPAVLPEPDPDRAAAHRRTRSCSS